MTKSVRRFISATLLPVLLLNTGIAQSQPLASHTPAVFQSRSVQYFSNQALMLSPLFMHRSLLKLVPYAPLLYAALPGLIWLWSEPNSAVHTAGMMWAGSGLEFKKSLTRKIGNPPISRATAERIAPKILKADRKMPRLSNVELGKRLGVSDWAIGWVRKLLAQLKLQTKPATPTTLEQVERNIRRETEKQKALELKRQELVALASSNREAAATMDRLVKVKVWSDRVLRAFVKAEKIFTDGSKKYHRENPKVLEALKKSADALDALLLQRKQLLESMTAPKPGTSDESRTPILVASKPIEAAPQKVERLPVVEVLPPGPEEEASIDEHALKPAGDPRSDERLLWLLNLDGITLLHLGIDARNLRLITSARLGAPFTSLEDARQRLPDTAIHIFHELREMPISSGVVETPQDLHRDAIGLLLTADSIAVMEWLQAMNLFEGPTIKRIAFRIKDLLDYEAVLDLGQLVKISGLGISHLGKFMDQVFSEVRARRRAIRKSKLFGTLPTRIITAAEEPETAAAPLLTSAAASDVMETAAAAGMATVGLSPTDALETVVEELSPRLPDQPAIDAARAKVHPLWTDAGAEFIFIDNPDEEARRAIERRELGKAYKEEQPILSDSTRLPYSIYRSHHQQVTSNLMQAMPNVRALRVYGIFQPSERSENQTMSMHTPKTLYLSFTAALQQAGEGQEGSILQFEAPLSDILDFNVTPGQMPIIVLKDGCYPFSHDKGPKSSSLSTPSSWAPLSSNPVISHLIRMAVEPPQKSTVPSKRLAESA